MSPHILNSVTFLHTEDTESLDNSTNTKKISIITIFGRLGLGGGGWGIKEAGREVVEVEKWQARPRDLSLIGFDSQKDSVHIFAMLKTKPTF